MPSPRRRGKRKGAPLTYTQTWDLLLGWWPDKNRGRGSGEMQSFDTLEEAREAWFAHRDEIYRTSNPGTRAWGWWAFESGIEKKPPSNGAALVYLIESGELTEGEAKHLREAGERCGANYWPDGAEAAWQKREAENA